MIEINLEKLTIVNTKTGVKESYMEVAHVYDRFYDLVQAGFVVLSSRGAIVLLSEKAKVEK